MDTDGDHAVQYPDTIDIKYQHNLVRDVLLDICTRSGISAKTEADIGLVDGGDNTLRPADLLVYTWNNGRHTCIDLTCSSPFSISSYGSLRQGKVAHDVAQRKMDKYLAKSGALGYDFLPFSFTSFGGLDTDALNLLKRVQRFLSSHEAGAKLAAHINTRVGFSIAKGVGAQIISRLPTNFL